MWFLHIIQHYSTLEMEEILTHATLWMNLEDIILSKISQPLKDKYCMIPIISKEAKLIETKRRRVVARGWWEGRRGSYYPMGIEFQFGRIKKFWRLGARCT